MIELQDELFAAPTKGWNRVPFTKNHHKWWLHWHRYGEDGGFFFFSFVSPKMRRYTFYTERGIVIGADIANANGVKIGYYESLGDKLDKLEAVLRLTPKHVIDMLFMLLDAIKERFDEQREMHDLFTKYAPASAELLDFIKWNDEYIVLYRDDANACTPYIIHHLNDSGLYYGHYYDDVWVAYREFHKMK